MKSGEFKFTKNPILIGMAAFLLGTGATLIVKKPKPPINIEFIDRIETSSPSLSIDTSLMPPHNDLTLIVNSNAMELKKHQFIVSVNGKELTGDDWTGNGANGNIGSITIFRQHIRSHPNGRTGTARIDIRFDGKLIFGQDVAVKPLTIWESKLPQDTNGTDFPILLNLGFFQIIATFEDHFLFTRRKTKFQIQIVTLPLITLPTHITNLKPKLDLPAFFRIEASFAF